MAQSAVWPPHNSRDRHYFWRSNCKYKKIFLTSINNCKGSFLTLPFVERLEDGEYFEDAKYWDIDEEEEASN